MDVLTAALVAVEENAERLRGADGKAGDTGQQGFAGPAGKPGLVWRGPWAKDTQYYQGDVVESEGSAYVATAPVKGTKPPAGSWNLLAKKGDDGVTTTNLVTRGGGGATLSDAVPLVESGAGAAGAAGAASRGDHVHPADPGGGGGAVDSVNGEIGVVVLDAVDVGAEPSGAVATHASAANPHPTYETSAEAQAKVDLHTGDATAAHAASAVAFTPAGTIAATDVQAAIEEVAAEAGGTGLGAPTTRTVASGAIDVTGLSYVIVNGEGGVDDMLLNMTGGVDGQIVYLEQGDAVVTVASGGDPPGAFTRANQERNVDFALGNFTSFMRATYSATAGTWWIEGDYVMNHIMSFSGDTEMFADDTAGLYFLVGAQRALQITEDGVGSFGKIGFFNRADVDFTVAQQTADTIDELWTGLKAYGLLDTGSTSPGAGGLTGSPETYTETNVTTDRAYNANATSIDELADVLGTLIADLRNRGVVN